MSPWRKIRLRVVFQWKLLRIWFTAARVIVPHVPGILGAWWRLQVAKARNRRTLDAARRLIVEKRNR